MPRRAYFAPSEYVEPSYLPGPGESDCFLGCRPWSRASEQAPTGRRCPTCGSAGFWGLKLPVSTCAAAGFVPLTFFRGAVEPGSRTVCLTCMEWGQERRVQAAMFRDLARHGHLDPIPRTVDDAPPELPEPRRPTPHYEVQRDRWARAGCTVQCPTVVSIPEAPMSDPHRLDSGPAPPDPNAPAPHPPAPAHPHAMAAAEASPSQVQVTDLARRVADECRPRVEALGRPHAEALRQSAPQGAQAMDWQKLPQYIVIGNEEFAKLVQLVLETRDRLAAV